MKNEIIRRKDFVGGGITEEERVKLKAHADVWIKRILRTNPIDKTKITESIKKLYNVAGLDEPIVVIAPSPKVMAIAGGIAAGVWYLRDDLEFLQKLMGVASTLDATDNATFDATREATRDAIYAATRDATFDATSDATSDATRDATSDATRAATDDATDDATDAATFVATRAATLDATDDSTAAATRVAIYDATNAATRDATRAATDDATDAATDDATRDATYDATDDATDDATHVAIYAATDDATYAATRAATAAATDDATDDATDAATYQGSINSVARFLVDCIKYWYRMSQGGNMWSQYDCYITAMRDVLGLELRCHEKYKAWEDCAIEGGFRIMHKKFCIISDFPEYIKQDENNLPHCETGPSHRWRDGWELYYWHGQKIPKWFIEEKEKLNFKTIMEIENTEERRCACEIVGWDKITSDPSLDLKIIDRDNDPKIGTLFAVDLPDLENQWFIKYQCGTGRYFAEPVNDHRYDTALKANAAGAGWRGEGDPMQYIPFIRT